MKVMQNSRNSRCHKNKRKQPYIYKIKSSLSNCNHSNTVHNLFWLYLKWLYIDTEHFLRRFYKNGPLAAWLLPIETIQRVIVSKGTPNFVWKSNQSGTIYPLCIKNIFSLIDCPTFDLKQNFFFNLICNWQDQERHFYSFFLLWKFSAFVLSSNTGSHSFHQFIIQIMHPFFSIGLPCNNAH